MHDKNTGNITQERIPFTTEEELARDAEEVVWQNGAIERKRNQKIENEIIKIRQEEQDGLRQQAEERLIQRGEIS